MEELRAAIKANNLDAVNDILSRPDAPDLNVGNPPSGYTFLQEAILEKSGRELVEELVNRTENINHAGGKHGFTALHLAVYTKRMDLVFALLGHRALDLNVKTSDSKLTPLEYARAAAAVNPEYDPFVDVLETAGKVQPAPPPAADAAADALPFLPPPFLPPAPRVDAIPKEKIEKLIAAMPKPPGFTIKPHIRDDRDVVPAYVTTLPKGTLLFRGLHSVDQIRNDLLGLTTASGFCLSPKYNVFFYPFPFIDSTVGEYEVFVMYVTTHDIQLGCFINPTPMARADRSIDGMPVTGCDKEGTVCGVVGGDYDPCYSKSFMTAYPEVTGMIAIAGVDRANFYESIEGDDPTLRKYMNKYFGLYSDSHNIIPAIPEIILYPWRVRSLRDIQTLTMDNATVQTKWIPEHRDILNYEPFQLFIPRSARNIKKYIDENLTSGVFSVDTTTGFFVVTAIVEESHRVNLVGTLKDLDPTRLRFTRAKLTP